MEEYELIMKYEALIYKITKKFYNVELDDLFQAGCIGLIKAYRKYDETKSPNFIDFAYKYIFGEMYELANKSRDIKLNKYYLKIYRQITIAKEKLREINNYEPSFKEVCAFLEIDETLASEVITMGSKLLSLDDEYQTLSGETLPLNECIGQKENYDDQILIDESLKKLEPLEQDVIKIRYFSDLTQMETAEVLGISQVKVSRLEQKGKQKIKEYIAT
jgi:RNA polymerase sporulation-specific sigma factor